jgi:hypothetical protein
VRRSLVLVMFSCLVSSVGCVKSVTVLGEQPLAPNLGSYQRIHLGWLDLGTDNWKKLEYKNPEDWQADIRDANVDGLQVYVKQNLPAKSFSFSGPGMPTATDAQLAITFANTTISSGAHVNIQTDVIFTELPSNKQVYRSTLAVTSYYPKGGHQIWNFVGRLGCAAQNIADFIATKF